MFSSECRQDQPQMNTDEHRYCRPESGDLAMVLGGAGLSRVPREASRPGRLGFAAKCHLEHQCSSVFISVHQWQKITFIEDVTLDVTAESGW